MALFGSSKIKKNINFLDLTPIKKYADERDETGLVSILIPRFQSERMAKIFLSRKKSNIYKVKLDELGSATWNEINGNQKVHAICDKLTNLLGEKINPAEQRITQFLSILYQQKCIAFQELKK